MTFEEGIYLALGRSRAGFLHASRGDWGPALCDQPLLEIDDSHKYSLSDLAGTSLCSELPSSDGATASSSTSRARFCGPLRVTG